MKYLKCVKRLIGIVVCIVSIYFQAFAQDTSALSDPGKTTDNENTASENNSPEDGKSVKLNTIVVTATKTKERLKDVPVHVDVITSKDIEAAGVNTLGDVIGQKITGHYQRYSGLSQPVGLTGNLATDTMGDQTSDRVIILIDGHKLGTGNLAKIPPEIIERVEVIKGPGSALYGSAAMGGVINIITKKGRGEIRNTAKVEAGSFDYLRMALTSGGALNSEKINDFASYFVTASIMQIGDYKTKNYGRVYNSKEEQSHIWGNISLYPSDNQNLRLGFSYADLISHYPQWNNYDDHTYYDENIKQYSDVGRGHVDLEYNLAMFERKLNWKAIFYELKDKRSWFTGSTGRVEDDATVYNDFTTGTDQQFEIKFLPYNKILTGYTFELLKRNAIKRQSGVITENTTPDFYYYTNSVYVQDTAGFFGNSLIITGGARYDKFNLDTDKSNNTAKDVAFDSISPRGGIVYKVSDIFRIRGNVGKAFRAPNADELEMNFDTGGYGIYKGNINLKPETSITYDGGFDIYPGFMNLGFTYSYIKAKNFITYLPKGTDGSGNNIYEYNNITNTLMEIINCYLDLYVAKLFSLPFDLNLSSNITFNLRYKNTDTDADLPFIADREVKSSIQTIYKNLYLTLAHVYVGHETLKYGDKKGSFYFFNLTAAYEITSSLSAELGIFNLTNKDYEWVKGYPAPERNYKIALAGKF